MRFVEQPGGPPRYQHWTDKPVRYFTVVDKEDGSILGYCGRATRTTPPRTSRGQAAGPRGVNEGGYWYVRLRAAKERGLRPSQALAELYGEPEPGGKGRPLPGLSRDAPNAAAVEALAAHA